MVRHMATSWMLCVVHEVMKQKEGKEHEEVVCSAVNI